MDEKKTKRGIEGQGRSEGGTAGRLGHQYAICGGCLQTRFPRSVTNKPSSAWIFFFFLNFSFLHRIPPMYSTNNVGRGSSKFGYKCSRDILFGGLFGSFFSVPVAAGDWQGSRRYDPCVRSLFYSKVGRGYRLLTHRQAWFVVPQTQAPNTR